MRERLGGILTVALVAVVIALEVANLRVARERLRVERERLEATRETIAQLSYLQGLIDGRDR